MFNDETRVDRGGACYQCCGRLNIVLCESGEEIARNCSIFYILTCTVYRLKKSPADEVDVVVKLAVDAEDNAVVT